MEYTIIPGHRYTSNLLYCNSYIYRRRSVSGAAEYYNCCTANCTGRAILKNGAVVISKKHIHEEDGYEYLKIMFKNDVKTLCRETRVGLRDAFDQVSRRPE